MFWSILGWIGLGLMSLLVISSVITIIRRRIVQRKQKNELNKIFAEHKLVIPTLTFGSSYGWPTFTVKFSSHGDYLKAKEHGTFNEFEKMISGFYDKKFDPKMAVSYSYPEPTS